MAYHFGVIHSRTHNPYCPCEAPNCYNTVINEPWYCLCVAPRPIYHTFGCLNSKQLLILPEKPLQWQISDHAKPRLCETQTCETRLCDTETVRNPWHSDCAKPDCAKPDCAKPDCVKPDCAILRLCEIRLCETWLCETRLCDTQTAEFCEITQVPKCGLLATHNIAFLDSPLPLCSSRRMH
jgi:hypothetical protein